MRFKLTILWECWLIQFITIKASEDQRRKILKKSGTNPIGHGDKFMSIIALVKKSNNAISLQLHECNFSGYSIPFNWLWTFRDLMELGRGCRVGNLEEQRVCYIGDSHFWTISHVRASMFEPMRKVINGVFPSLVVYNQHHLIGHCSHVPDMVLLLWKHNSPNRIGAKAPTEAVPYTEFSILEFSICRCNDSNQTNSIPLTSLNFPTLP